MEPRYHVNRLAHEIAEERIEEPRERIRLSGLRGLWATIVDGLRAFWDGFRRAMTVEVETHVYCTAHPTEC